MFYDNGAPTIEVRIYRDGRLLVRELCETEDEVATVVARRLDRANARAPHISKRIRRPELGRVDPRAPTKAEPFSDEVRATHSPCSSSGARGGQRKDPSPGLKRTKPRIRRPGASH
jgi:hypothetical protein